MAAKEPGVPPRSFAEDGFDSPPPPAAAVVAVNEISKAFGETRALQACSFFARAGEVHALVGENGSGKSTLAKVMSGVMAPDSGRVSVGGGTPKSPLAAHGLGLAMVSQEILMADGGSVLDNLFIGHDGMFRAKMSQREKRVQAKDLLDRLMGSPLDLDAIVDDLPLSTRQWIVIARALLSDPRVVIFDEATAALDQASVERFLAEVRRLQSSDVCVVVVTHRINEIKAVCDHATVLSDGVNVGTLVGDEITEERLLELMQGKSARAQVQKTAQAAVPERLERGGDEPARAELLTVSGVRLTNRSAPIDLAVQAGEVVGLAGLEGQGQAEFIRTVAGINKPVAGDVLMNLPGGQQRIDSERAAQRAGIAYIPGDRKMEGIFPNLSVFENFGMPRYRQAATAGFMHLRKIRRTFEEQAGALSIRTGRLDDSINSLSGGNQQKIVIGRSLAAAPLVVALNDPTRGVDIATKHDLYELLHGLAAEGKGVLFLSNEIEEFDGLCERVAVFRSGSIFTVLAGEEVTDAAVLAALFGHVRTPEADQEFSDVQT